MASQENQSVMIKKNFTSLVGEEVIAQSMYFKVNPCTLFVIHQSFVFTKGDTRT